MIGGECRADFVIGNDGEIDQKTKNSRAEKIPKSDGRQEHDGPEMRKGGARLRTLLRAELEKAPGFEREERERNHLRRREKRAHGHAHGRVAREIEID